MREPRQLIGSGLFRIAVEVWQTEPGGILWSAEARVYVCPNGDSHPELLATVHGVGRGATEAARDVEQTAVRLIGMYDTRSAELQEAIKGLEDHGRRHLYTGKAREDGSNEVH